MTDIVQITFLMRFAIGITAVIAQMHVTKRTTIIEKSR